MRNDNFESEFVDDEFMRKYTEKQLKRYSNFQEYTDEAALIKLTTTETLIIHFYSQKFPKCTLMNKALACIAPKFPTVKFGCINVEKCPTMCGSLKIGVLPFLGFFKDGYFVDDIVGFEKIGNSDVLSAEKLENYIKESEICSERKIR